MRQRVLRIILTAILLAASACVPHKLSKENYIKIMTDLGCNKVDEESKDSEGIYKKYDASPSDLEDFRKTASEATKTETSQEISKRISACVGLGKTPTSANPSPPPVTNTGTTAPPTNPGWPQDQRDKLISSCVQAANPSLNQEKLKAYCACYQKNLETAFPDINDLGTAGPDGMKKAAEACLPLMIK